MRASSPAGISFCKLLFSKQPLINIHAFHIKLSIPTRFSIIWKKMCPERTKKYEREIRIAMGHLQTVQYIAAITV